MAAASTGIIGSAMTTQPDPNAPQSTQTAATTGTSAPVAPKAAPNTITSAPSSPSDYANQLNAAATPSSASAPTPAASIAPAPTPAPSSGIIASAKQQVAPTAASVPAATPAPSPAPATAADINSDFASDFGRPAAAQGISFFMNTLAQNPGMTQAQLNQQILQGAQSQDQVAAAALNGGGSVASNWTSPQLNAANVQSSTTNPNGADTFNTATNSWQPAGTASGVPSTIPTSASTYNADLLSTPTQLNVGANQTVAGQLQNIDNANSPLIQAARTQALQQANANGLLNSTMAITAGDTAAYNASLPIAQQDAATNQAAAATNAAAANTFATQNQNAANTADQFNSSANNTLTEQQLSNQTALSNAQTAANTSLATNAASNASSQEIAQLQATNNANIQTASSVQNAGSQYQNALNNIANVNTDAQGKYDLQVAAYNTYLTTVEALSAATGVPDVSSLLQFNQVDPKTGVVDKPNANGTVGATASTPAPTPVAQPDTGIIGAKTGNQA